MFQFSQQINSIFPSDSSRDCTQDAKDGYNRSPFYRGTIRDGHNKDFRHQRASHKHDQVEVH